MKKTEGVSIVTGDPKRAILKLSGPMIVAMLLMSIYNLIDAVWVAGLGGDALAAIGFAVWHKYALKKSEGRAAEAAAYDTL
jgi:Na+-driven multidrug efflux pump